MKPGDDAHYWPHGPNQGKRYACKVYSERRTFHDRDATVVVKIADLPKEYSDDHMPNGEVTHLTVEAWKVEVVDHWADTILEEETARGAQSMFPFL